MDAITFHLQQQLRRYLANAESVLSRLPRLSNLRDLVHAGSLAIPREVRHVGEARILSHRIERAIELRAESIIAAHLEQLALVTDPQAHRRLRGAYRSQWECLRGHFPRLYADVLRKQQSIPAPSHAATESGNPPPSKST